jgi:hypothetical protein
MRQAISTRICLQVEESARGVIQRSQRSDPAKRFPGPGYVYPDCVSTGPINCGDAKKKKKKKKKKGRKGCEGVKW